MVPGVILSSKKTLIYSALSFSVILAMLLFYHFIYSKNLTRSDASGQNPEAAVKKVQIRQLDAEIFSDDKFRSLKENKVDWPDYGNLKTGNKNPFGE